MTLLMHRGKYEPGFFCLVCNVPRIGEASCEETKTYARLFKLDTPPVRAKLYKDYAYNKQGCSINVIIYEADLP